MLRFALWSEHLPIAIQSGLWFKFSHFQSRIERFYIASNNGAIDDHTKIAAAYLNNIDQ